MFVLDWWTVNPMHEEAVSAFDVAAVDEMAAAGPTDTYPAHVGTAPSATRLPLTSGGTKPIHSTS